MQIRPDLMTNPSIHTRAFQLALEIVYHKRSINENILQEVFSGKLSILDLVNRNEGITDMSTFYSAGQASLVVDQPRFSYKPELVMVIAICKNSYDLTDIPSYIQRYLELSKPSTANTLYDIFINEKPIYSC